jgi:Family of unknown function (DUF5995)
MAGTSAIDGVVLQLQALLDGMAEEPPDRVAGRRPFLATYLRTTRAVGEAVREGAFEDPEWVEKWDVAFAELYVDALVAHQEGRPTPRPWRLAFEASSDMHPLGHVLLGVNAHINFDQPQSLLRVMPPRDFEDPDVLARRHRDHEAIDAVLNRRVAEEGREFDGQSLVDRALTPFNRAATRRFLRESRRKVWHNTRELHAARLAGPEAYERRLGELEVLTAARIADLLEPGPVLLRLAVGGFGVRLPPSA